MFPMPITSFEMDTKAVDLLVISLPNSVINSVSFFRVSISRFSFVVHKVSSFISFKKKGPSHHKELLDRS